ncbi:MAG: cell division protein SepF [Blautia sp.]|nr:cell division protein SepF [Blautia sp.]
MSVLDRFLDAIKLNDDYDDDYLDDEYMDDEDDFLDDDYEDKPKRKFFDKFSRKKNSDSDDDYLEQDLYEPSDKLNAKTAKSNSSKQTVYAKEDRTIKADKTTAKAPISSKITPMRSSKRSASGSSMEVCVIKPSSMEDTSEIADSLKDNSTVILNLEGIDMELAQRIIDFTCGSCYSLGGSLQKVSSYIFILVPSNVDITGDFTNILGGVMPSVKTGY